MNYLYLCSMIFYFSGTGNTKWAARQLAEATGEELFFIPDLIKQGVFQFTLAEGERLGFCFPTHGWQPPRIVREFVRQSHFSIHQDTYIYALTTCGDNMGQLMRIFSKELKKKGLKLHSAFTLVMPESNVCFSFLHLDTKEKERQKIADAKVRMKHIIEVVSERKAGISELVKGAIPRTYSYILGGYYNKHLIKDDKFWVDKETCIRCGLCAKLCPVDDIALLPSTPSSGKDASQSKDTQQPTPTWIHNGRCTNCLACYHNCPRHAIHWAKMKRGQYVFKDI